MNRIETTFNQQYKVMNTYKSDITNHSYIILTHTAWQKAIKELSNVGFKLYMYMSKNSEGYEYDLSPSAVNKAVGMCKESYRKAFKELKAKGYIVQSDTFENGIYFRDNPDIEFEPV